MRIPRVGGILASTFERFTEEARLVVVAAEREARACGHNYIGTEHLLLGLVRGDSEAARMLRDRGVTRDAVRARLLELVPAGDETTSGQLPFTPRAKKAMELALREALSLGHNHVGPEQLLLGMIRTSDGVAVGILTELEVDLASLRERLLQTAPPSDPEETEGHRRGLGSRRGTFRAHRGPEPVTESGFRVEPSPEVRRLFMSAGARALDDGRTEIEMADVEAALRLRRPPEAASG